MRGTRSQLGNILRQEPRPGAGWALWRRRSDGQPSLHRWPLVARWFSQRSRGWCQANCVHLRASNPALHHATGTARGPGQPPICTERPEEPAWTPFCHQEIKETSSLPGRASSEGARRESPRSNSKAAHTDRHVTENRDKSLEWAEGVGRCNRRAAGRDLAREVALGPGALGSERRPEGWPCPVNE